MSSPSHRILLVDGNVSSARAVREILKRSPDSSFELVIADSPENGLRQLAGQAFDALLLNVPSSDRSLAGLRVIQSQFSTLPIITLIADASARKEVLKAGAIDYLVKGALKPELLEKSIRFAIERKQAEEAFRKYEQRFHDLFENAKDILFTLDLEGNITSLNKSAEDVFGWSRSEVLHNSIKEFVAPEHRNLCAQMMQRILQEEPVENFEISLLRKDGRRVILESSARLLYSNGQKQSVQGIARDVTERHHLENMLRQSQKLEAIGRLSGGVAHDFNNLLCVISGHAELLSERLGPAHPTTVSITQIKKAADSAASLTRQLLAFSRKQVFHPQVLDLNVAVTETKKLLGRLIGEHIDFHISLAPALDHVRVDPVQIEQVLVNLALNARDAMPLGGQLTIETSNIDLEENHQSKRAIVPAGKYVLLAVSDTGSGMDEETQSRIFDPFFTTKELGKGSGLGLATVYGIIKQSGGFIWVYSEPGQGATFKVYFPRVDNPLTHVSYSKLNQEACKGTETILLAEDAEPLRVLAQEFLKECGYRVLEAQNGTEALRIACAFDGPIHLLLTDVVMPGMGGKHLAEELATLRPTTKVLYMSGYPSEGIVRSGFLEDGLTLLEKPFTREILLRRVRQMLDGQLEATPPRVGD